MVRIIVNAYNIFSTRTSWIVDPLDLNSRPVDLACRASPDFWQWSSPPKIDVLMGIGGQVEPRNRSEFWAEIACFSDGSIIQIQWVYYFGNKSITKLTVSQSSKSRSKPNRRRKISQVKVNSYIGKNEEEKERETKEEKKGNKKMSSEFLHWVGFANGGFANDEMWWNLLKIVYNILALSRVFVLIINLFVSISK